MNFQAAKKIIIDRLKRELPPTLSYHTVNHTLDVINAVSNLAESENIDEKNRILLKTAALFHDAGFLEQYSCNEPIGCKIAEEILPSLDYTDEDIKKIKQLIMATKIPQTPSNKLEEIICDADLDYLGRDDFPEVSQRLRDELKDHHQEFSDQEWLNFEIKFLEKHNYFTKTAQKMRNSKKKEYINNLKLELKNSKKNN